MTVVYSARARLSSVGRWSLEFRRLVVGANPSTASGTLTVDGAGVATFSSLDYSDTAGGSTPADIAFTMLPPDMTTGVAVIDQFWGALASGSDATLHGKLAYDKDLFVFTRTEASGDCSFTIALK